MNIYILKANLNNYQTLEPVGQGMYERYRSFDGKLLSNPLAVLPVKAMGKKGIPAGDFPGLASHIPVLSQRGVDVLAELLASAGEMIPLSCTNCQGRHVAMNVTCLLNALDVDRSKVERFKSSGRITRVLRHEFLKERLSGATIFKIPETAVQRIYVTEKFVQAVAASGLRGFVFELVWTDGMPVILCPYCMGVIGEQTGDCPTCGLDTTRDAAFEMTMEEALVEKRAQCPFCGTRIRALADPCPYCKRGKRRQGVGERVVIV